MYREFNSWFAAFVGRCRQYGYRYLYDARGIEKEYYSSGTEPEVAADLFISKLKNNNSMNGLSWLNDDSIQMTVPEEVKATVKRAASGPRKARNPEKADLRIFDDGSIYPSAALIAKFNLEYAPKDAEQQGVGFDVIDSEKFVAYFTKLPQRVIFISPVNRSEPKIDVFGSTYYFSEVEADEYNKELAEGETAVKAGDNKSKVLTQGSVTFGKQVLLPLLKEVYDAAPDEKTGFLDLVLDGPGGQPFRIPANKPQLAMVPKTVSRGKDKDAPTTIRRENPEFWVLVPVAVTEEVATEDEAKLSVEDGASAGSALTAQ